MSIYKDLRLDFAKRRLESELSKIFEIMGGHKDAGLPAGHEYYKKLRDRALKAIVKYQAVQTKLGVPASDYMDIAANVPTLKDLEDAAEGVSEGGISTKVAAVAIGSLFASFGITIVWAINHNLYLLLTFWADKRWDCASAAVWHSLGAH